MGSFYTNYTVYGTNHRDVAEALAGRTAIVTPEHNGCVVVFDKESDEQDVSKIATLASKLSRVLKTSVLALLNHDDDILWYQFYQNGELADEYNSAPGYFDPTAEPSPPVGGSPQVLCAAFGVSDIAAVEGVLRKSSFDEGGYSFAIERHSDLVAALGISDFAVGTAYASFEYGEYPEGLTPDALLRTN